MLSIFVHDPPEGIKPLQNPEDLIPILEAKNEKVWMDMESPSPEESTLLSKIFHFHPLAIEDCFNENHLPKIDDYDSYFFIIVNHGAIFSPDSGEFSVQTLSIFVSSHFIVTLHNSPSRTISRLKEKILKNHPSFMRGTDYFLHDLLDGIVDNYFPVLDELDSKIDELEEEVFHNPTPATFSKILLIRKNILNLKRVVVPQREIFNQLSRDKFSAISDSARFYFRDVYDHLVHIFDLADSYYMLISGTRDAYLANVSNKLNEIMKVLTVISTIMLPLTLITGIYGMNFVNIPELKDPNGYFKTIGVMVGLVVLLLYFFKRKKWI